MTPKTWRWAPAELLLLLLLLWDHVITVVSLQFPCIVMATCTGLLLRTGRRLACCLTCSPASCEAMLLVEA